ncbi:MAG: WecB/TagA/CpsF family glycosyltransferase [Thermoleophilia bacterium]
MVCAANVHMVMEAWDDPGYRAIINGADLVVPDGQPLVWALRWLGVPQRRRVRVSPDLLVRLFAEAERSGSAVGLYGGSDQTLPQFMASLAKQWPSLRVPFAWAPPFRPLTTNEDAEVVERISAAGVRLLLVGLGCPKQERWMAEHRERLSCVMIGVGAAFDLFGGRTKEAPRWTRDIGLEWAWRLVQEPRRLWRRHARHDPRFIALLLWQIIGRRGKQRSDPRL